MFTVESFNLIVLDGGDVVLRTVLQVVPTVFDLVMTSGVSDVTDVQRGQGSRYSFSIFSELTLFVVS